MPESKKLLDYKFLFYLHIKCWHGFKRLTTFSFTQNHINLVSQALCLVTFSRRLKDHTDLKSYHQKEDKKEYPLQLLSLRHCAFASNIITQRSGVAIVAIIN